MRRSLLSGFLCLAALASSGCNPRTVLCTISCPVYQPPETPQPDWPKQCGGQKDLDCSSGSIDIDRKAATQPVGSSLGAA